LIRTVFIGPVLAGISSDGGHVWVSNPLFDAIAELNPSTGHVVRIIPVGPGPQGIASDGAHVWVANGGTLTIGNTVTEIRISPPVRRDRA
jgi:DNA-binding beta-propeller fold protein YncE